MKLPEFFASCDDCIEHNPEAGCRYPEEVAWGPRSGQWLCHECWAEMENVGEEQDATPLVFASDALLGTEERMQRLIAAATRRRMGVK